MAERNALLRRGVPVAVASLVVAGTAIQARAGGDDGDRYRTVAASVADVEQVVELSGTVSPVEQADAGFQVSGTVATVDVSVGQTVTAGQQLASLDADEMQTAVLDAEAALARARAELETAQTDEPSSSTDAATDAPDSSAAGTVIADSASAPPTSTGTTAPDTTEQRAALTALLAASATAGSTATAALAAAEEACQPVLTGSGTGEEPDPDETTGDGEGEGDAATSETAASNDDSSEPPDDDGTVDRDALQACLIALSATQEAQDGVAQAQAAVASSSDALVQLLLTPTTTNPPTPTPTTPTPTTPAPTTTTSRPTSTQDAAAPAQKDGQSSASRVASAEVAVLEAEAGLAQAQQGLADAVLTAPLSGTVAALPFRVGGPAATSDAVTVVGSGPVRITVAVPLATVPLVEVGQAARVTPDGATEPVSGTVEQIGLLPATTGGTTYPVTVLVPAPTAALAAGATAAVTLVIGTVEDAVTVPNSALTSTGTAGTGSVLVVSDDGQTRRVAVTTGAVGAIVTEVVSGVDAGDEVVLADLDAELPSSSANAPRMFEGLRMPGGGGGPLVVSVRPPGG